VYRNSSNPVTDFLIHGRRLRAIFCIRRPAVVRELRTLALLCALSLAVCGQETRPALTNRDIAKMTHDGFTDGVIVALIDSSDTTFDVSVSGLTSLKEAGVTSKVMETMLKADAKKRSSSAAAAAKLSASPGAAQTAAQTPSTVPNPAISGSATGGQAIAQVMSALLSGGMGGATPGMLDMSQLPPVTLMVGGTRQTMRPSIAQVANTQTKGDGMPGTGSAALGMLTGLGSQTLSFGAVGGGMFAGPAAGMALSMMGGLAGMGHHGPPKITYVWALPGLQSSVIAASSKPRFEMEYGNLLGIDPDAYEPFIVKLVKTKDNWRLVGATKSTIGQLSNEAYEKVTEVRVKSTCERHGRGQAQVVPGQALEPGEYAIVLRALHPGKRSHGSLGGPAEQTVFFSVWDFTIQ
jgi:hypothetical protein